MQPGKQLEGSFAGQGKMQPCKPSEGGQAGEADVQGIKQDNRNLAEQEIKQQKKVFWHYPDVLQIELTSYCNARCIMCHHYYEGNARARHFPAEVKEKVKGLLPYASLVLLNGYGEPFLAPDFPEWLGLLHTYQAKAMVTTNLSVLKEEWLPLIRETFQQINISCDGYGQESYEKIRQGLSFGDFVENVRRLRKSAPQVRLSMSVVAMAWNIRKASEIVRFASSLGFEEVRFGRLGVNSFLQNYAEDPIHYEDAARKYFGEAAKEADRLGIKVVFPMNYRLPVDGHALTEQERLLSRLPFPYTREHQERLAKDCLGKIQQGSFRRPKAKARTEPIRCKGICDWVARGLYLDCRGKAASCCENSQNSYGNLGEMDFGELWNGPTAQETRGMFYQGRLPDFCFHCPFLINQELSYLEVEEKKELFLAEDYEGGAKA